ncbi:hypothetical protein AC249_AIPGENE28581 [Exaiptasia diaphana]|nr:hypothetical protein AC249_AIPGENE28581 [Exaiptasia diaphana]
MNFKSMLLAIVVIFYSIIIAYTTPCGSLVYDTTTGLKICKQTGCEKQKLIVAGKKWVTCYSSSRVGPCDTLPMRKNNTFMSCHPIHGSNGKVTGCGCV